MSGGKEGLASPGPAPFLVCGMGHVGFRIVELLGRLGERSVVVTLGTHPEWRRAAEASGATLVTGDARDLELLRSAGLMEAKALLAVTDNDPVNLEIALDARRLRPDLPIVVRLFDQNLAEQLEARHDVRRALSVSALVAPAFAGAALGETVLGSFTLDGKLDIVIREGENLLVIDESEARKRIRSHAEPPHETPRRSLPSGLGRVWKSAPLGLRWVFITLVALSLVSAFVFSWAMDLSLVDAFYFVGTTVTTVGYGDNAPADFVGRLVAAVVMLTSVGLITVITAIITSTFVGAAAKRKDATDAQAETEGVARLESVLQALDERLERMESTLRHPESTDDDD